MPTNKWLGLNNYNKFKTNKNKLIGWTIPHFFCEGQAYNALDDPEEIHCSIQVCSLQAHVKRAERRGQTFASACQKKHCECICKYTRKIREHNVSLVIIGFQGRRHEAVTHHQHTYNMHQVRLLKAVRWAPALEGTPSNGPGTSPYHHTPQEQGFLQLNTVSWMSLCTEAGFPYCCLHQKLRSHVGKNMLPWWGAGSQHPAAGTRGSYLLRREDRVRRCSFIAKGILEMSLARDTQWWLEQTGHSVCMWPA